MESKMCPICGFEMSIIGRISKEVICDGQGFPYDGQDYEGYRDIEHEQYHCGNCEIYTALDFKKI